MRHRVFVRGGYRSNTISEAGGEATGPVFLHQNPTLPSEASTKQYVDITSQNIDAPSFVEGILPPERLPAFTGDIVKGIGSSIVSLAPTGVPTGNFTKVTVNIKGQVTAGTVLSENDLPGLDWGKVELSAPTTLAGYGITDGLVKSNAVMTGILKVNGAPVEDGDIVNKQYVDNVFLLRNKTGEIEKKLTANTPLGYLRCNGGQVDKVVHAALYSVIGDLYSYDPVTGSGKPWVQQYKINDQQSNDITGWVAGTSLPGALSYSQAIVTKNRVYLLGGRITDAVSTVYTAPINADGTLGAWTTGTSLPGALYGSAAIVTKNRVYLLGGYNGTSQVSTVYTAPINADGTLGAWSVGTSLIGTFYVSASIITKNRVYLLGGATGTGTSVSNVYTAPINADGTLGAWAMVAPLPAPVYGASVVVTKNRVYLLGGAPAAGTSSAAVYTAPINADGTLGAWVTGTPIPGGLYVSSGIVTNSRVYLLGGFSGAASVATVYVASFIGGANDYSQHYQETATHISDPTKFGLPNIPEDLDGAYTYIKH